MANKKWIQKANKQMKKKGTVGAFTEYCGGRVTQRCIDKAKASEDPKLVRQAVFAENMRGLGSKKKAQDGLLQTPGIQPAAIEQNLQVPQLQVPGASVADAVTGGGLNVGGMLQGAGMSLAGKGQDLLKGLKGGKIGVSAATDLLAKGATALINKKSGTADDDLRNDKTERTGAAVGGAIKGAGKGFDLGNKIIPGLGGVIGGAVGAIGGAFKGKKGAEKDRLAAVANMREQQAGQYGDILKANAAFTARAGGMKLPGGQVVPLPDGGKHYIGKKHESGGIDLKKDNIEVEGGETERPIVARDGKTIDYIFSEHHKVNKKMQAKYGVGANTSYADIHRKMEEGGMVANYQELAKDQEDDMKKKGKNQYGPRGSQYIARRGGVKRRKAQDGNGPWGGYNSRFEMMQAQKKEKEKETTKGTKKDSTKGNMNTRGNFRYSTTSDVVMDPSVRVGSNAPDEAMMKAYADTIKKEEAQYGEDKYGMTEAERKAYDRKYTSSTGPTAGKTDWTFNEAYSHARSAGKKTFEMLENGKWVTYSTRRADETIDQFNKSFTLGTAEQEASNQARTGRERISYGPSDPFKNVKRSGGLRGNIAKLKAQSSISPEMLAAMQKAGINPGAMNVGPGIDTSKIPKKDDKLTSMTDAEMKKNEAAQKKRKTDENIAKAKTKATKVANYVKDNPLDAAQVALGGVAMGADAIPIVGTAVSAGADLINAGISGGRSVYYGLKGDKANAGLYGGLAAMDLAAAAPGVGNAAGASKIGTLLSKATAHGTKGGKIAHRAHQGAELATKVKGAKLAADAATQARYGGTKMKAQSAETNALTFNNPITGLSTSGLTVGSPDIGGGLSTKAPAASAAAPEEQPVSETNAAAEANTTPPTTASSTKPKFDVFANAEEGNAFRQWLNTNMPEDAQRLDLDAEGSHNNAYIRRAWGEFGDDFEVAKADEETDEQQFQEGQAAVDAIAEEAKTETTTDTEEEKTDEVVDAVKANTPGDSESTVEETTALKQSLRDLKKANRAVPPEALAAMAAQAVAPIYALTNKPPRVGGYAPQSYQAPKLGRVSGEADKDRVDQNMSALLASMEGQAMGPAAAANYANLLSQAQQQKGQIDQRTRQANLQLGAREAQMQTQASQFNIAQNQRAQEYMRNLALMQNQEEFANKFGALQAMGQGIAGSLGDVMKYKSDQKVAKTNVANTLDKEGKDALERANIAAIEKRREMQEELNGATAKARQAKQDQKESDKAAKKNKKALDKAKKAGYDTVEEYEAAQAEAAAQKAAAKQALRDARKSRHGGYTRRRGGIRRIKR